MADTVVLNFYDNFFDRIEDRRLGRPLQHLSMIVFNVDIV